MKEGPSQPGSPAQPTGANEIDGEIRRKSRAAPAIVAGTLILGLLGIGMLSAWNDAGTDVIDPSTAASDETPPDSPFPNSGVAPTTTLALETSPSTTTTALVRQSPPPRSRPVFAEDSPFNLPISEAPSLDPRTAAMSSFLGTEVVADLYEFGIAIYEVDNPIPETTIECTQPWGECPLEQGTYPIPADAEPAPGDDGTMVIVDRAAGRTVELWQPVPLGDGSWRTSWGTTTPLDGSGIPEVFGNGAGISHLAGVVRVDEIAAGQIDHALVFSTNNACREEFRYPAVKTDGTSPRADCIPEGARVQLDPSIDIETIRLSPAARAIARALQVYGAYAVDSGGSAMALYFEVAADASFSTPGATYVAAGLKRDYADLSEIPWRHLRVLRAWDGS